MVSLAEMSVKRNKKKLGLEMHDFNPSSWQADVCGFKTEANVVYKENFRPLSTCLKKINNKINKSIEEQTRV